MWEPSTPPTLSLQDLEINLCRINVHNDAIWKTEQKITVLKQIFGTRKYGCKLD
jgi:hypothetical protein